MGANVCTRSCVLWESARASAGFSKLPASFCIWQKSIVYHPWVFVGHERTSWKRYRHTHGTGRESLNMSIASTGSRSSPHGILWGTHDTPKSDPIIFPWDPSGATQGIPNGEIPGLTSIRSLLGGPRGPIGPLWGHQRATWAAKAT